MPVPKDADEHTLAWLAVVERLKQAGYAVHVGMGQSDVVRLRFASHDPDARIAWGSRPVTWRREARPRAKPEAHGPQSARARGVVLPVRTPASDSHAGALATIDRMIREIGPKGSRHVAFRNVMRLIGGYNAGGAISHVDTASLIAGAQEAFSAVTDGEGREGEMRRTARDAYEYGRRDPISPAVFDKATDLSDVTMPTAVDSATPISDDVQADSRAEAARPPQLTREESTRALDAQLNSLSARWAIYANRIKIEEAEDE